MSSYPRKSPGSPAGDVVKAQNVVVTDSEDDAVTQRGIWTQVEHPSATDLTYIYSETNGNYLEFKFKGTGIWLRYFGLPDGGKANVSIDGGTAIALDTYAATERVRIAFAASNLTAGEHKIKVEVTNSKNDLSLGYKVGLDAFIVELSRGAMQIWAMIEESLIAHLAPETESILGVLSIPWWIRYRPRKIIYLDDFEGVLKWSEIDGTVEKISDINAFEGDNSLRLTTAALPNEIAEARRALGFPGTGRLFAEFRWHAINANDTILRYFRFRLDLDNGTERWRGEVRFDNYISAAKYKRWAYLDETGAFAALPGGDQELITDYTLPNFFRLGIDMANDKYISFESNELFVDMSEINVYKPASTGTPRFYMRIQNYNDIGATASVVHVDAFAIYFGE